MRPTGHLAERRLADRTFSRKFNYDASCALPQKETLARSVRRQRTDHKQDGNVLTDELKSTLRGDDYVLHDSDGLFVH